MRVFRRPASGSSDRKRLKMLPPPSKAGTALESRSPTAGQRPCPPLIAPHRKRNHMSRAGRTTPTVLTDALAEAWPAPADLCARARLLARAKTQICAANRNGIVGVSLAVAQPEPSPSSPRRAPRPHVDPSYPGSPLGAPVPRDITSPSPTRSGQSSRDHAPSRSARPASSASRRRRQHPAVHRPWPRWATRDLKAEVGFPAVLTCQNGRIWLGLARRGTEPVDVQLAVLDGEKGLLTCQMLDQGGRG